MRSSVINRTVILRSLAIAIAFTTPAIASAQNGKLPPIIDRELFFGNPEISGAQISPDGRFISFLKPYKDTRNVWVKKIGDPYTAARLMTNDIKRPVTQYFWSRDGKYILYVQDQGGDENFNVYAVDPTAANAAGQDVPTARNLTAAKGVRAQIYSVPKNDPDIMYVGINDRDKAWHDLYRVRISTGERTLMRQNTEHVAGWVFDNAGALRLAVRTTDKGDTEILRVDPTGFTQIYSCTVFETCGPDRFNKDNTKVYMETNKGAPDLTRLILFDPATKTEQLVESDPLNRVDFGNAIFSDVSDELVGTTYEDERTRVYWKDTNWESAYNDIKKRLPGKEITLASHTADEMKWMIIASSDREPGERYLWEAGEPDKLTFQYRTFEKLPRESLAQQKAISYKSSDGLTVPAYLTLPVGVAPKNLPLVVFPHGGPWGRDSWGYSSIAQFLANRGYAVLQPNFRASTGYGKKFLNAGNNEWGQKMQDDLTYGVRYLVSQGTVDPKRVGIMGGSYGGYATLAGLAFTPDVYAAGVSIVGPSNLITLLNSIPPYWESVRTIFNERMGNPNTPAGLAQLQRQSPLNSAAKIKAPLLVIQGANDPRVNKAESEQIVVALRDRGFPVEYILAPDEGHGFARPINNLVLFTTAEKFLAKHLGGRYQQSMTPAITERMAVLTVDPKSVVLAKKAEVASTAPKPTGELKPGTQNYKARIEANGQTIPMSLTRTVKDAPGSWVVTDSTAMPMGTMSDESTIDKGTLLLRKRVIHQGPATIDVSFADNKATGTMSMNGQERPINADVGGSLFADGPGATNVVATLPLAEGYSTTYRNFDLMGQKVKLRALKVTGSESVTVPAGTFDAWKVEITPADGGSGESTTLWVDKASRQVVKISSVVPEMNGAIATAELTK
jgi:dipeptidyl aminopeptidase/acylaminoacyl peptidase